MYTQWLHSFLQGKVVLLVLLAYASQLFAFALFDLWYYPLRQFCHFSEPCGGLLDMLFVRHNEWMVANSLTYGMWFLIAIGATYVTIVRFKKLQLGVRTGAAVVASALLQCALMLVLVYLVLPIM